MTFRWPESLRGLWEKGKKYRYVLLAVALGVLLLLLPTGSGDKAAQTVQDTQAEQFDLDAFEEKLADTLSRVAGAGRVRVVLTVDSGSRRVLAQDVQRDEDSSEVTTVTVGRGSGAQDVVALQTVAPRFRGALVVCDGGGDAAVRLELVGAVSALTGLGSDRISICRGN